MGTRILKLGPAYSSRKMEVVSFVFDPLIEALQEKYRIAGKSNDWLQFAQGASYLSIENSSKSVEETIDDILQVLGTMSIRIENANWIETDEDKELFEKELESTIEFLKTERDLLNNL